MAQTDRLDIPDMHGMIYSNAAAIRLFFDNKSIVGIVENMITLWTNCQFDIVQKKTKSEASVNDNFCKYKRPLHDIALACFWMWDNLTQKEVAQLIHEKLISFIEDGSRSLKREQYYRMNKDIKRVNMHSLNNMEFPEIIEKIHLEHIA